MISVNECPVPTDAPKYEHSILGFQLLAVHVLYNTSWTRYNYTVEQIWPAGQRCNGENLVIFLK